jgi:hypothetical protein
MKWQDRTKRELWMSFLSPASLLLGLWGLVFFSSVMLGIALALRFLHATLSPGSYFSLGIEVIAIGISLAIGHYLPLFPSASILVNGMIAILAISTFTHLMEVFGNSHRLLEKLVESGEFQDEHARFEHTLGRE